MSIRRISTACVVMVALLQTSALRPRAQQRSAGATNAQAVQGASPQAPSPRTAPQTPPQTPAPRDGQAPGAASPPGQVPGTTFREGINFVRVDAIVTDGKGQPVTDLKQSDFAVTEDGKPQSISQFKLVRIDATPNPDEPPVREIRNRDDEEAAAAGDDVRVFAILLDDYHVRLGNSLSIRRPLTQFIQTQLRPSDMVAIMYPMTPVADVSFTHDPQKLISAIEQFKGRKYDYQPMNDAEARYARYPTEVVERIRNQVVMGALRGLSVRLGSMRTGRKSLIFVSEGLTVQLPPQMRRADATVPQGRTRQSNDPETERREQTQEVFSQADLYGQMRDVYDAANRNNTSIYSLDPRGLAVGEFDIDDGGPNGPPRFATDNRALQMTQDTLRTLSTETDGIAIVNRNTLNEGLAQIAKDASFYYLIGYSSTQEPTDGKFHEIKVKLTRPGLRVRARRGYWAVTEADARKAETPTPEVAKPVERALASIAPSVQAAKYVRTWIGTERGEQGKTRVTLVWEPLPHTGTLSRDTAGQVSLIATTARGDLVFRGRSPDASAASTSPSTAVAGRPGTGASALAAAASSTAPQRLEFEAPPGALELQMTVRGAGGVGTLDQDVRTIQIPDLTAPQAAISTPRVYHGRTVRDLRALAADANAIPAADREFSRTERLLIRFSTYAAGGVHPQPTAVLLNRAGQKMTEIPVTATTVGGTHQIDLGLNTFAAGEYLIQITVDGAGGHASELIPIRVTS